MAVRKEKFIGVNEYPNPADKASELVEPSSPRFPLPDVAEDETQLGTAFDAQTIAGFALHFVHPSAETVKPIEHYAATEAFEQLRAGVEMKRQQRGKVPNVFLLPVGHKAMRAARANFAQNFYEVAGLEVTKPNGFDSVELGMAHFSENPGQILVICSSDAEYPELIPQVTKALGKMPHRPQLVLAGNPIDVREEFEDMGIEDFVYAGCDVYEVLKQIVK